MFDAADGDGTVVRALRNVRMEQTRFEVWQRQDCINGPSRERQRILPPIETARPAELEEVRCNDFLHALLVKARLLTPKLSFETLKRIPILLAQFHVCSAAHCDANDVIPRQQGTDELGIAKANMLRRLKLRFRPAVTTQDIQSR